eukprot:TRINITY_DN67342_c1_g1_i1.p1 TRINITY_DN67342_c1_g1~~TRINITY_DN67342_c1_g1_i1.p1  ORF type:complete len:582 (+),score=55.05 TRINITY_DN67342_c1_g1_i1:34-1779(+)
MSAPSMLSSVVTLVLLGYAFGFVPPQYLQLGHHGHNDSDADYIREVHYIPMRDGVKLHTIVFIPTAHITKKKATVMIRTPYGATGLKGEGATFVKDGFVAVMQDFRGRFESKGKFECWRDAGSDGADTIDWITKQTWSNTVVFQAGTSANGIANYLDDLESPKQLHAQLVIVATAQLHRTLYQNGAYRHSLIHGWLDGIHEPAFEKNFIDNEQIGPWWNPLNLTARWNKALQPAVHVTGWYDIFNQQTLDAYTGYHTSATIGKSLNYLIVLPTGHCQGGAVAWPNWADGLATALGVSTTLFKALADADSEPKYLETIAALEKLEAGKTKIWWYVMGPGLPGTKGNYWTQGTAFPKSSPVALYLGQEGGKGTLSTTPPKASAMANMTFTYDPTNPVPTLGGNNLLLKKCGPWDQSSLESRSDVLTFTTQPLNATYAITGKMWVILYVSTTPANDTDFTVKLTDVFPNGTSLLIQDSIIRMRWRNTISPIPEPMQQGKVYEAKIDLWSTSYIFNSGHAVRLDVSSSNYPRFSANPNTGLPLADKSTPIITHNTVHFGAGMQSRVVLPIVPMTDLPETQMPHRR